MIEVLAPTLIANFLLPYVRDGVDAIYKKVTDKAGEEAGNQAAELTKQIWARVKRLFSDEPQDAKDIDDFEHKYKGSTAEYLQQRLEELLAANPAAARELQELAEQKESGSDRTVVSVMGNSGVTATVTISNSSVSGTVQAVSYGSGPASAR
jgi:hypothetical protein